MWIKESRVHFFQNTIWTEPLALIILISFRTAALAYVLSLHCSFISLCQLRICFLVKAKR